MQNVWIDSCNNISYSCILIYQCLDVNKVYEILINQCLSVNKAYEIDCNILSVGKKYSGKCCTYMWQNQPLGGSTSLVSACSMPTLTKALGQWQLSLADGFRVRTHVPGVWGSIPSQVDPMTYMQKEWQFG